MKLVLSAEEVYENLALFAVLAKWSILEFIFWLNRTQDCCFQRLEKHEEQLIYAHNQMYVIDNHNHLLVKTNAVAYFILFEGWDQTGIEKWLAAIKHLTGVQGCYPIMWSKIKQKDKFVELIS